MRRAAMIADSTYLPSTSWSTTAASSIHGTGAQNFSSALRKGRRAVFGIAFGPNFVSRMRASSSVRPRGWLSFAAPADVADDALGARGRVIVSMFYLMLDRLLAGS